MRKTKKNYELSLNELGCDYDQCVYLTNKSRNGGCLSPMALRTALHSNRYGSILRKYDPIAFECGFNDWRVMA